MEKVKLSVLPQNAIIAVGEGMYLHTVKEILEDTSRFKDEELYTTTEYYASFNAKYVLDRAIEDVYCNGMYEDWDCSIEEDVTVKDIEEIQNILDRILARNPQQNIAYHIDKLIEIDV